MKVQNMKGNSGKPIPNQFIITDGNITTFQSYKTIIAQNDGGIIYVDKNNPFSVTTSKYLYKFLNVTSKEFQANVKSGKYIIVNLNS